MSGSVSTCQARTAAYAPKDTHCRETGDTARVSGVIETHTHTHTSVTVLSLICRTSVFA